MAFVLGVTGGVGTGKSTFTKKLLEYYPSEAFDADQAVRDLLENDLSVRGEVLSGFPQAITSAGVDREILRRIVFSDQNRRRQLEAILHPKVREKWLSLAEQARAKKARLIVDIPLLFETASEKYFDATVVVACTRSTQVLRLKTYRRLAEEMAESIINAQQPLAQKILRANFLIWNDSSLPHLDAQAKLFAGYLKQRYGRK